MDQKRIKELTAEAGQARQYIAALKNGLDELDARISTIRAKRAEIERAPIHIDDWIAECLSASEQIAEAGFARAWLGSFITQQDGAGWRLSGEQFHPLRVGGSPNIGVTAPVLDGALLYFLGPKVIEAGLRRLVADTWPDGALKQADRVALLSRIDGELAELQVYRDELAASLSDRP